MKHLHLLAPFALVATLCHCSASFGPQDATGNVSDDAGAPDAAPGLETDSGVPTGPGHEPKPKCPADGVSYFLEQADTTWGMVCVQSTVSRFFCCVPPPPGCMCDNTVPIPHCAGTCDPIVPAPASAAVVE